MATSEQSARLDAIDPRVLGERLRDRRLTARLGQAEVASAAGVSVSYVSRIEAGKRRCDLRLLGRMADFLNVTIDALLAEDERTGPDDSSPPPGPVEIEFARVALEMGEARSALDQLDRLTLETTDPQHREWLLVRGRALEVLGRRSEAIEHWERIAPVSGDPLAYVPVATALSRCYRDTGEYVRAIRVGEETLHVLEAAELAGTDEAVQLAVTVAAAYFEQGDREYALRLCQRTLRAAEALGTPRARASAYWNYAIMDLERGNAASAIQLARRAYALLGEGQDERNLARLQIELGIMELRLSPPDVAAAAQRLDQAEAALAASAASDGDLQRLAVSRARLALLAGDVDEASTRALEVAAHNAQRLPQVEAEARVIAGEAALARGDVTAGRGEFLAAVRVLSQIDDVRSVAQLWLELGARLYEIGEFPAAADAYQRAAIAAGLTVPSPSRVPADRDAGLPDFS